MREEILRMDRIVLDEQGVGQLDGFHLSIFAGEIMGLLPLNNHGLTALLHLLQHNIPLRGGYVYYREEPVNTWHAGKPGVNRIGIIQSESCLVDDLTVADNIFVLRPGFKSPIIRPRILREQLLPFLKSLGVDISAGAYVKDLSVFQRVVVELLKAVVAGSRLIVLRDIGSHISELELLQFQEILQHYAAQGISFLYIGFHAEELRQICDRVALMANGKILKILKQNEITYESFLFYTGAYDRKVRHQLLRRSAGTGPREVVLEARNLTGDAVCGLSFSLVQGECLVLQDLDNQIFGELLSMLTGDAFYSGELLLDGEPYRPVAGGNLAIIQELPTTTMLFGELSYLDNLCFSLDRRLPELWRSAGVRRGIRQALAVELGEEVFACRVDMLTEIQKYELVYTRIALQKPRVVFCVQPFRRADFELRMRIWELLKMLLDKGIALVILAVSLADTLSLADRLIRVQKGAEPAQYTRDQFSSIPLTAPWLDLYKAFE